MPMMTSSASGRRRNEELQSLVNRVNAAVQSIQNLRPADFTLDKLDEELASMAMIRSLPEEYSGFVSSLLLMDKMDKATISRPFHTEETQHCRRSETENSSTSDKALAISSKISSPNNDLTCDFCHKKGHVMEKMLQICKAQKEARKPRQWNNAKAATEQKRPQRQLEM